MLKGFKEFIMRGNVIDLAVAVVIGAAFIAIVNTLIESLLNPALGALFNAENLRTAFIVTIPTLSGGEAELAFGAVLAAIIQFLLVAAAVYFALVLPINRLKERAEARREAGMEPKDTAPTELDLLTQIRDLLSKTEQGSSQGSHAAQ